MLTLLALAACDPERPKGAYDPVYATGESCPVGFDCSGGPQPDAGVMDGGVIMRPDTGTPANDAGPIVIDPTDPLAALAGRYLMRVDYYSTAIGMSAGSTLNLKTRVSNLFYVELATGGSGALNATERFCDQVSAHECETGCSAWQTLYSTGRFAKIAEMAPLARSYSVDASGNLSVTPEGALLRVGYNDDQASTAAVPTTYTDPRVWQLSAATDRQRGMATSLQGTLLAGISVALNCEVDTVQLYATAFKGSLGAELTAQQLATRIMKVTTAGSDGKVIQAVGDPAQVCNVPSLQTTTDTGETAYARFLPTDLTSCPTDGPSFEGLFPLPAEANLNPPTPTDQ